MQQPFKLGVSDAGLLRRIGILCLFIAVLVLLGTVWTTYLSIREARKASLQLEESRSSIRHFSGILSAVKDAETGQRGMLLTGKRQYLEPYTNSLPAINTDLQALGEIARHDPNERSDIEQLSQNIAAKLAELRLTLDFYQRQGLKAALDVVESDRGRKLMDNIRELCARAIAREERRSAAESHLVENREYLAGFVAVAGSILLLGFLLAGLFALHEALRLSRELNQSIEAARQSLQTSHAELQKSNEMLSRANEELQEFAFAASHDLQEPLRTVLLYSELLERGCREQLEPRDQELLRNIVDGAHRMRRLIEGLLSYLRLSSFDTNQASVSTEKLLDQAISHLKAAIAETGAVITHDPLPDVQGNAVQLTQVFQNLIANAIKYRKPDAQPRVHISAAFNGTCVIFGVQDNGIGFERKYSTQIFGLFKRLHGSEIPGTGIGLALCRRIVERHGGQAWAESQPGSGSTFFFSLPQRKEG